MKAILVIFIFLTLCATTAIAKNPYMGGPSNYTKQRIRVQTARNDRTVANNRAYQERVRIRTNQARREEYRRNQAHNARVLRSHKK